MADNELLVRLATVYAGDTIDYPQLRAVTLAQWILESGGATSDLATLHYNFGGLKWRNEMAGLATKIRYEAHDGVDFYCKFATLENFISGYWTFLNRTPYSGWESHVATGDTFIEFIGPIYTPSSSYVGKVKALVPRAQALLFKVANEPHDPAPPAPHLPAVGTLIIDPGHGGTTNLPGSSANNAISVSGVKEKKLTLDFCLILRDRLLSQAAAAGVTIKVVLTRTTDTNMAGSQRAGFAFAEKAKALICLHFNGAASTTVRGAETFFRAAENGNLNLAQDIAFAKAVHAGLIGGIRKIDPGAPDRGVKPDNLTGPGALGLLNDHALGNDRRPDKCVAAYIEAEYITHPKVDKLLIAGPDAIANRTVVLDSLAGAIIAHLRTI